MGLQIPNFTFPGVDAADLFEHVSAMAVTAEESGFDSVWVMDHFYQLPQIGKPDQEMFECYSLLTALAARTGKVMLGAMVGGMTYRNPAFLAKTVTGLDVISRGRAIWGIGAGWFDVEHEGYGYEFGTFSDRFQKLEEGLQIVTSMFVNETTTFDGTWFRTHEALNVPKPIQAGGPPVLIGGSGERKTLRMVAQYADACNVFGEASQVRHLMGVLDDHCERLGRNPADICRTRLATIAIGRTQDDAEDLIAARFGGVRPSDLPEAQRARLQSMMIYGGPDSVGEQVQALLDAGLDGLVFNMPNSHDLDAVALAGQVLGPLLTGN
jgi:F420-dependent oxidoreductase-like protein